MTRFPPLPSCLPLRRSLRLLGPAVAALLLLAPATSAQVDRQTAGLRRALIIAADGTLLGACDASEIGVAQLGSPFGTDLSLNSLFNPLGPYGSEAGTLSAANPDSSDPPYLMAGTPGARAFFTDPRYQPGPAVAAALRRTGGTRITVNARFPLRLTPAALQRFCATVR